MNNMQLRVHSLGKRHSSSSCDDEFWSESICVCVEVTKFSKSFQQYSDTPCMRVQRPRIISVNHQLSTFLKRVKSSASLSATAGQVNSTEINA